MQTWYARRPREIVSKSSFTFSSPLLQRCVPIAGRNGVGTNWQRTRTQAASRSLLADLPANEITPVKPGSSKTACSLRGSVGRIMIQ